MKIVFSRKGFDSSAGGVASHLQVVRRIARERPWPSRLGQLTNWISRLCRGQDASRRKP